MVIDEKAIRETYSKISHLNTTRQKMSKEDGEMFDSYINLLGNCARGLIDEFREKARVYLQSRDFERLSDREKATIYFELGLIHSGYAREYFGESKRLCYDITPENRAESIFKGDLEGITGEANSLVGREFSTLAYLTGGLPQTIPQEERQRLLKKYLGNILDLEKDKKN